MLLIDSTDVNFITAVQTALETLLGGHANVLAYQQRRKSRKGASRNMTVVSMGASYPHAEMTHPKAAELIQRLISHADHKAFITQGVGMGGGARPEGNRFTRDRTVIRNAGNGTGTHCELSWVDQDLETANMMPNGRAVNGPCPKSIILAHELVHGDHIFRGRFLFGSSNSVNVIDTLNGTTAGSMVMKDDIYNIGLVDTDGEIPADAHKITENDIRDEQEVPPRVAYGRIRETRPLLERRGSHHDLDLVVEVQEEEARDRAKSF